jgi:hypothetical protein
MTIRKIAICLIASIALSGAAEAKHATCLQWMNVLIDVADTNALLAANGYASRAPA